MKLSKKILSLLIIGGISISIAGCDKKEEIKDDIQTQQVQVTETIKEENKEEEIKEVSEDISTQYEEVSKDINSEEQEKINNNNTISEKEALKIVEEYVHQVLPKAKLKAKKSDLTNYYCFTYDNKYASNCKFYVNISTDEVYCYIGEEQFYTIKEWLDRSKMTLSIPRIDADEAKSVFLHTVKNNEFCKEQFSDYQIDNIELAEDYQVEINCTNFGWVFRYPMEEEHKMLDDRDYSERNAYNKNDKYGYFYVHSAVKDVILEPHSIY